ncbi:MAG TPA: hypothetical protein VEQ34_04805, partial [Pyrinomonadaceae bacterium]|nr:hypothetical protein [Pyrinomonadaceae bacterium]
ARVVLTGDYLSESRYVLTNQLGYYRFVNVPVYFGYQIMISAKNRRFAQSSAALTVIGDTANLNFTSNQ